MPGKPNFFKSTKDLISHIAPAQDKAAVGAAIRCLIKLDAMATIDGYRAPITLLRKESLALVKKKQGK